MQLRIWSLSLVLGLSLACSDRDLVAEGGSTEEPSPGEQPSEPGAMYAPCESSEDCPNGLLCVYPEGEVGYCAGPCAAPTDPGTCDPAPGDQPTTCIDLGLAEGLWVCALDCADAPCPNGMRCEQVMVGAEARSICF